MANDDNILDKVSDKVDEIDNDLRENIDGYIGEGTYDSVKEELKDAAIGAARDKAITKGTGLLRKFFTKSAKNNVQTAHKPKKVKPEKFLTPKQKAAKHGRFIGLILAVFASLIGFQGSLQGGLIGAVLSFLIIPISCGYGWTCFMNEPDFFQRIVLRFISFCGFAIGSFALVVQIASNIK